MNKLCVKFALFTSVSFWIVATALYITAMLTDYWISIIDADRRLNYGLFKICPQGNLSCKFLGWNLKEYTSLLATRITMLVGAGCVAIGLIFGVISLISRSPCPLVTKGSSLIVGGLVIWGACALFTGTASEMVPLNPSPFHYSFYFGWFSGLFYVISGICTIIVGIS